VPVSMRQQMSVGRHLLGQRLRRRMRFPLVMQLEPLFACNLACAGCGKVQFPPEVMRGRMPVATAVAAVMECGARIVSVAGGEPLIHPDIVQIIDELVARKRFVYLCTNGLLMASRLTDFRPSAYFSWTVHLDGLRERHDASVGREGVFDSAVDAIKQAKAAGFRVTTNSTFYSNDSADTVRELLDFLNDELHVDAMMISPGYQYETAPDQEHFLHREQTRALFREVFAGGRRDHWRLNHSPLFLDFLEGKVDYRCSPWGVPSYSILGWQRPCYLQADGYCATYRELLELTDWSRYGPGNGDPRCDDCMAHCGYEPSAVLATTRSLRQALRAARSG
jgi:hopanoid biosynthesis associated radical SAM protein HpnH